MQIIKNLREIRKNPGRKKKQSVWVCCDGRDFEIRNSKKKKLPKKKGAKKFSSLFLCAHTQKVKVFFHPLIIVQYFLFIYTKSAIKKKASSSLPSPPATIYKPGKIV